MSDRKKEIEEAARADLGTTLHSVYEIELWCRGARWGMNKEHENAKLCPACGRISDANPVNQPTGDDERDAKDAAAKFNWTGVINKLRTGNYAYKLGFLAGRKGMVPAAEVEKAPRNYVHVQFHRQTLEKAVAEARREEQERIRDVFAKLAYHSKADCPSWLELLFREILNPKEST